MQGVLVSFTQTAIDLRNRQSVFVSLTLAGEFGEWHFAFDNMTPKMLARVLYQHQHLANPS